MGSKNVVTNKCDITYTWNFFKYKKPVSITKKKQTHRENSNLWSAVGRKERVTYRQEIKGTNYCV